MKLVLDGAFEVAVTPEQAYAFLTSPERFAPLLPMFRELKEVGADDFKVVLDIGVPQIRGRAEAHVKFLERISGRRAGFSSTVSHPLGVADSTMALNLAPSGSGTRVEWASESIVRGTLASVASGILRPLAKRNVAAMVQSVQKELAS